jgi:uncharacterized protein
MPTPLSEAERQEFLAGTHVAVLTVAASDGRPPVAVPIWYDYIPGGNILINTAAGARKARLVSEAGAVTVLVQREEPPYRYVIVEGTVLDAATPSPREAREAIAARYLGAERARAFAESMDANGGHDSVLFTIRPDRWITRDFSDLEF